LSYGPGKVLCLRTGSAPLRVRPCAPPPGKRRSSRNGLRRRKAGISRSRGWISAQDDSRNPMAGARATQRRACCCVHRPRPPKKPDPRATASPCLISHPHAPSPAPKSGEPSRSPLGGADRSARFCRPVPARSAPCLQSRKDVNFLHFLLKCVLKSQEPSTHSDRYTPSKHERTHPAHCPYSGFATGQLSLPPSGNRSHGASHTDSPPKAYFASSTDVLYDGGAAGSDGAGE
jgi:hypothetical protein